MVVKLSPFFTTTRRTAIRCDESSAANALSKSTAVPSGTRMMNGLVPGGVIPRNTCGFRSLITATEVPAAIATAASGVCGPTRTESYANGGKAYSLSPYRAGSFAISAAAMSCGT
jgi:hypothetical protein